MMKTTAISTVVFVFGFICGRAATSQIITEGNDTDGRILGGSPAADGQFPYQVQIRFANGHHCGGSIISNIWILTAGHCIYGVPPQNLLVVAGTIDRAMGGISYRVIKTILHEGYEDGPSYNNDIALLRVDRPIDFRYNIQPVRLASRAPTPGFKCIVSGWGLVNSPFFNNDFPRFLQFLYQDLLDTRQCYSLLMEKASNSPVRVTNICAFTSYGRSACKGDSGGPLACDGIQYGVVSWGIPCGKGDPDVYTSVFAYRSWIALKSGVNV